MTPWAWLVEAGPWGLVALTMVSILLGWLVPWRTHRTMIAERDAWQNLALEKTNQMADLIRTTRVLERFLNSLPVHKDES